jgi:sugar phosphate isomerase/epimerase
MFKFSVFTVMLPDMMPAEAAVAMKAAGYDGVEWRVKEITDSVREERPSFWGNNLCTFAPKQAEAERARQISEAAGLAVPGLGTYIEVGDITAVEQALAFAQTCDANMVRIGAGSWPNGQTYADSFAKAQAFLTDAQALAKQYRKKVVIEIHHRTIVPSASLAHRLVADFDPAYVGVIHDAGNMVHEGFENYLLGLQLLGPHLAHVHIKNGAWTQPAGGGVWQSGWSPLEDGVVNWAELLAALRAVGYEGWLGLEDFSQKRPSREALSHNIQFLRQYIE